MKRSILWLFICVLILGLCGCSSDAPLTDATQQVLSSEPFPPSSPPTPVAPSTTKKISDFLNTFILKKLTEEQLRHIKVENYKNVGSITFDLDSLSNLNWGVNYLSESGCCAKLTSPLPYSYYIESLKNNGVIVAGYAYGLRESRRDGPRVISEDPSCFYPEYNYTLTQIHVTDVYYGTLKTDNLRVYEGYSLEMDEEGFAFFCGYSFWCNNYMRNGVPMLMFLEWNTQRQCYISTSPNIPLMPDYRNYNDAYLNSVLNFFRGDRAESALWSEPDAAVLEAADPDRISNFKKNSPYLQSTEAHWPKRSISDEELLAEMSDHMILQLAMRHKIALWPYGHRNFVYDCTNEEFILASLPPSE